MASELAIPKPAELASMSTDDLRRDLVASIGLTARAISRVAAIWDELARRGIDLSDVKFALRDYMRRVATGQLLPEAVAQLAGSVRTLSLVADLPVSDQRRLIDGDPIQITTSDGIVEKRLSELTWPEAARVIRGGHILSPKEQELARSRMMAAKRKPRNGRPYRIVIDRELAELRIGKSAVNIERVIAELRAAGYI